MKGINIEVVPLGDEIFLVGEVPTEVHKSPSFQIAGAEAGSISVDTKGLTVRMEKKTEAQKKQFLYVVKSGDTLAKIAYNIYGRYDLWGKIYEANKDNIKSIDIILEGQVLQIPDI